MSAPPNSARNFISMQQKYDRVVLLVDMDCFYCQVEEKLNPDLKGQPVAVVQYNAWRGGGIIAVNYAARAKGVTRHMRGDEAKEQCPEIQLVHVPNVREKADLSKYREAGKDVAHVLQKYTLLLERASVDEAYLDVSEAVNKRLSEMNAGTFTLQPQELIATYAVGYERFGDYIKEISTQLSNPYCNDEMFNKFYEPNDIPAVRQSDVRLLLGAAIASEIRTAVKSQTGYECSAGIAHNKIIAKLACGMNKPNKQTIMPLNQIDKLFEKLPLGKIKGLGGKFGEEVCERLKIKTLGQVLKFTETELQKKFDEKNGTWLFYISRGIDLEAVTPRFYSKSIGCCKKFPGRNNITGLNTLKHWLNELASEIAERLEKDIVENNRKAKQMTVSYIQELDVEGEVSSSRSVALLSYEQEALAQRSLDVIKANTRQFFQSGSESVLNNPIKFLGISVGKFETIDSGQSKLAEMFANQALKRKKIDEEQKEEKSSSRQNVDEKQTTTSPKQNERVQEAKVPKKGALERFLQPSQFKKSQSDGTKADIAEKTLHNSTKASSAEAAVESLSTTTAKSPVKSFFIKALQNTASTSNTPDTDDALVNGSSISLKDDLPQNETSNVSNVLNASNDSYGSPVKKRFKLPECEEPGNAETTPANSNYQTQYAEYASPELRLDLLEFHKCEICGSKIPLDERILQTHRDHHFAMELSQQMRAETRSEIAKNVDSNKNNNKTNKSNQNTSSSKTNNAKKSAAVQPTVNITKFLKPKTLSTVEPNALSKVLDEHPSTSSEAQTVLCEQCNKLVKQIDWNEHLDYHIAKDLQRELNKQEIHTVTIGKKSPAASSNQAQKKKGTKPISTFFTQNQRSVENEKAKN